MLGVAIYRGNQQWQNNMFYIGPSALCPCNNIYCIRVDLKYINSLSPNSYFKKVLFVYYISAEHLTPTSFGMGGLHQNEKNLQKKAKFE
jgi:hypothetical protein